MGAESTSNRVLVTGGSGFVGAAVVRTLQRAGYRPRVLARAPSRVDPDLGAEVVAGDLTDLPSVEAAVASCAAVIHCAADYRLALRRSEVSAMVRINVGGTFNVLRAAHQAGIDRVVHCSTVGTLAFDASGRVCSELDPAVDSAHLVGPYKRSKWAAERIAMSWTGGPEVVVVQPSTPIGAGDRRPTPTGATIRDFLQGRIPAFVATGLNLVDVEAVARGHLLALERGRAGRSYILGDRNLTLEQLLGSVAAVAGLPPPKCQIPLAAAYLAALSSEVAARLMCHPPTIPMTSVRMAAHPMWVDSSRARQELRWSPGDLDRALREAVADLSSSVGRGKS